VPRTQREFEGKDLEEALHAAAASLGVPEPDLDYEIIEQGRRGLFGIGAKSVRIRVMPPLHQLDDEQLITEGRPRHEGRPAPGGGAPRDPRPESAGTAEAAEPSTEQRSEPRRRSRRPRRRPRGDRAPAPNPVQPADDEELDAAPEAAPVIEGPPPPAEEVARLESTVREMLRGMGLDIEVRADVAGSGVSLELEGADQELLLGGDAEPLGAMQFLLNRMARRSWPAVARVDLSCDGRQTSRDDDLVELVKEVAQQVSRTGRAKRLHPMNAYERRLVHLTVRKYPGLGSRSEGQGGLKKVRVFKQGAKPGGGRPGGGRRRR